MKDLDDLECKNLPAKVRWPPNDSNFANDRLHVAVLIGKVSKIKEFVCSGTPVDVRNRDGQTSLFCAAFLGKKNVVKTLLFFGADPNARCLPDGYTAMHGACFIGSVEILKLLLEYGGDLRLTDTKRQRPFAWVEYQPDVDKRREIRQFVEGVRYSVIKTDTNELLEEFKRRGTQSPTGCDLNVPKKVITWLNQCSNNDNRGLSVSKSVPDTRHLMLSTGFGRFYLQGKTKCAAAIGLPSISEVTDLRFEPDLKAPSWICGKFSTFVPMTWTHKNTSITLKTLRKKSVDEAVTDILISELDVLTRLHHPRILLLMAVCQEENFDSLSLVFEKVAHGSLYFFLHHNGFRMRSTFATDLVIQISEALDYVHASGYLHCGVTSHAVMLVSEGHAKLSGFEYAITVPSSLDPQSPILPAHLRHPWLSSDSHLSLLKNWMAPEVLRGSHPPSQASDVYSLCSVMWEMIFGDVPWKDHSLDSLKDLLKNNVGVCLPLPKNIVPQHWFSLLTVGLKPNVNERDLDFAEIRYMMGLAREKGCQSPLVHSVKSLVGVGGHCGLRSSLGKNSSHSLPRTENGHGEVTYGIDMVDGPKKPPRDFSSVLGIKVFEKVKPSVETIGETEDEQRKLQSSQEVL